MQPSFSLFMVQDRILKRSQISDYRHEPFYCLRVVVGEEQRAFDQRQRTIVVRSCAPAPLWELMKILQQKYPDRTISSSIASNDEVLRSWESGECDVAVLPFRQDCVEGTAREFMQENLFVCVPADHELAKK